MAPLPSAIWDMTLAGSCFLSGKCRQKSNNFHLYLVLHFAFLGGIVRPGTQMRLEQKRVRHALYDRHEAKF
jgi:hypothetical protein